MSGFTPRHVGEVAADLGRDDVHVWWLPYQRVQGRAALRSLLAQYLRTSPEAVTFVDGEHGRPALAAPHRLNFNWSHSGDHALVAVAYGLPQLGVDIERQRERARTAELAERYFHPDESAWLDSVDVAQRGHDFLRLWTAKEAVLKAHGRGIAYGLHRVTFADASGVLIPRQFDGELGPETDWQIQALQPLSGLLGALAWRGAPRKVCLYVEPEHHQSVPS